MKQEITDLYIPSFKEFMSSEFFSLRKDGNQSVLCIDVTLFNLLEMPYGRRLYWMLELEDNLRMWNLVSTPQCVDKKHVILLCGSAEYELVSKICSRVHKLLYKHCYCYLSPRHKVVGYTWRCDYVVNGSGQHDTDRVSSVLFKRKQEALCAAYAEVYQYRTKNSQYDIDIAWHVNKDGDKAYFRSEYIFGPMCSYTVHLCPVYA